MPQFTYEADELIVERCDSGAFRLIWLEKDPDSGARSVCDIVELQAEHAHRWANAHGELLADKIRARWPYDIGKARKTSSVVRKIVEQWSDLESETHSLYQGPSESVTVALPVRDGVILVRPTLDPLAAKERLEKEGPFSEDGWSYEWDDDAMSPFVVGRICLGDPRENTVASHEFFVNGEPGEPIDQNSFWLAV